MPMRSTAKPSHDLDGLRLLALSRIPRCGACPRLRSLVEAHATAGPPVSALPPVPPFCSHPVCKPLAVRWTTRPGRVVTSSAAALRLRAS